MQYSGRPSLGMRFIRWLIPYIRQSKMKDVETLQAVMSRTYPEDAPVPEWLAKLCHITARVVEGQWVTTLTPRSRAGRLHILYLHGGGYVNPLVSQHWDIIGNIIKTTGASFTVPAYFLSPEHDHRDAWRCIDAVFDGLAAEVGVEHLAVGGDSAGGNFALSLVVRRRDAGLSLPRRVFLFSPWLDMTFLDPSSRDIEPFDPMLRVDPVRICGQWWAKNANPADPAFSPLFADPKGLTAMIVFQGTHDILCPDTRSFVQRAAAAGVDVSYHEYEGAFHVFVALPFLIESRDAFHRLGRFLS